MMLGDYPRECYKAVKEKSNNKQTKKATKEKTYDHIYFIKIILDKTYTFLSETTKNYEANRHIHNGKKLLGKKKLCIQLPHT